MGQDPMRFVDRSHDMSTDSTRDDEAESFALCACKNGKIFVVGPDDECQASPVFCNEPTVNSNSNEWVISSIAKAGDHLFLYNTDDGQVQIRTNHTGYYDLRSFPLIHDVWNKARWVVVH